MNVTPLKPKMIKANYKKHKIVVEYIPEKARWMWTFDYTTKMVGMGDDPNKAMKEAKKEVDRLT